MALKEAAVYFEHVIPFATVFDLLRDTFTGNEPTPTERASLQDIYETIFPPELASSDFLECYGLAEVALSHMFLDAFMKHFSVPEEVLEGAWRDKNANRDGGRLHELWRQLRKQSDAERESTIAKYTHEFTTRFRTPGLPIISAPEFMLTTNSDKADICIAIRGLKVINPIAASWDQISELRKDKEATAQLRRLRLFAAETYHAKGLAFMQDDLLARIDSYEEQSRRWGLETTHASFAMVLSSRTLHGSAGALGMNLPLGIAAAGTMAIEIGKIALEVSRRSTDLTHNLRDNPISYVMRAKKALD